VIITFFTERGQRMTITPQLIKDQEFESKFRGFDPIEVKDYLETIADEFFELQEKCKEQEEELGLFREARESSEEYNSSLETDMEFTRKISEELKDGCAQKEEKIQELIAEVEELQLRIADMEQENAERDEEASAVEAVRKDGEIEAESLRNKIVILQEQNNELKKEEVDFKSTLATAQRFAEDLKERSQVEAIELVEEARAEIERIRDDAQEELDRLPLEIQALENKKETARAEVKALLENYLETIDVFFPEGSEGTTAESDAMDFEDDGGDLFQKIVLSADGTVSPEDAEGIDTSMDEEKLDSLLRDDGGSEQEGDDQTLKEMFSLDEVEGEKKGSF